MDFFAYNLPLLLSVTALVIVVFSFIYLKSYLKRRTSQKRILSEFQEEVNNILKSINETTDRDISLIEGRERELKNLLEEIERRLKTYIRELERTKKAEKVHAALSQTVQDPVDKESKTAAGKAYQELGKKRYKLNRQKIPQPAEAGHPAEPSSSFPLPDFKVKSETNPPQAPSTGEQIRSLLLSGFSPPVVASRLEVSIAEVELAAALLERRER